jgi:hypothetical protein
MIGRVLSETEEQLLTYGMSERKAVELARYIVLPEHATHDLIENSIMFVLTNALQHADGRIEVEYVGGQRRDLGRMQ